MQKSNNVNTLKFKGKTLNLNKEGSGIMGSNFFFIYYLFKFIPWFWDMLSPFDVCIRFTIESTRACLQCYGVRVRQNLHTNTNTRQTFMIPLLIHGWLSGQYQYWYWYRYQYWFWYRYCSNNHTDTDTNSDTNIAQSSIRISILIPVLESVLIWDK